MPSPRIISGGQTGVDRAALDVALERGLEIGGWCPAGRAAEDGVIPDRYPLRETPSPAAAQRTEWNVRDADATLIIARDRLAGGTALTERLARARGCPLLIIDPDRPDAADTVRAWLETLAVRTLNVAGPRASEDATIADAAAGLLREVLA